jgi:hypothetical protein
MNGDNGGGATVEQRKNRRTYPRLLSISISSPKLLESSFLLFAQIRKLFSLRLVQTIDDRILALLNMDALDLACYQ